ncbi:diphthine--ammonia ligase [Candidatus Woesearchaeota archaeon]|nr:diphthine--ammonia ligase [Candidatus Woesearchaeota archaeon]
MCGIVGIFHEQNAGIKTKTALKTIQNRGKDACGLTDGKQIIHKKTINELPFLKTENCLGHILHAVINKIPHPLQETNNSSILVANCEIYNWQELNKKYSFQAKNDAELMLKFFNKFSLSKLSELNGVYAFAYWQGNILTLTRDLLGERPLWYTRNRDCFAFASEKKALEKLNYLDIQELNPRQILIYNQTSHQLTFQTKDFFSCLPEHQESFEKIKTKTQLLLDQAIEKRLTVQKCGLLFSGGIDSTYLAHYFQSKNLPFTCYTAVLDLSHSTTIPSDLIYARKVAQELNLNLKIKKIKLSQIPKYIKKIVPLIEDSNVTKVGVALTFFLACELAKKDGCKVIYSGLGSEEIFAGYERHKNSSNINQECLSGLLKIYERDLYRDDVLTMHNQLELRLPFLDKTLIEYALKIPAHYKINASHSKLILREIALKKNIPTEFALRKKTAAQYGSRLDYAIEKLAKQHQFPTKSSYLKTFYPSHNLKLGLLFSGGKDSLYAGYIMKQQNYDLTCLITIKSQNPSSYMFHTPNINLTTLQAQAMDLPLIIQETTGEKEVELKELEQALKKAQHQHHIEGIITGAVFSTYQRNRIEKIADKLGLKIFSPLWHKSQEQEMHELLQHKFKIILSSIAAEGLDKTWLNKILTASDIKKLQILQQKYQLNINGEGGEYESFVLDCPLFNQEIIIKETKIIEENKNTALVQITLAELTPKNTSK